MLATTPENVLDYIGLGVTKSIRFWGTYARKTIFTYSLGSKTLDIY